MQKVPYFRPCFGHQVILLFLVFILMNSIMGYPATIHVITTQDVVPGSLRAAISAANSCSEDTVIFIPTGRYILVGSANEDGNSEGDLDINTAHKITITGFNKKTTIIDGDNKDRVFHILNGIVNISGITIINGNTPENIEESGNAAHGGGINNNGNLTLKNCIISHNSTGNGYECNTNNKQNGGNGGNGGGIANFGSLAIQNCTVENNISGNGGDSYSYPPMGICCYDPGSGGDGGGIYNCKNLHISSSTVRYNKTGNSGASGHIYGSCGDPRGGNGGGIFNSGKLWVDYCIIHQNSAGSAVDSGCDGACSGSGGSGGGIFSAGAVYLSNSTISNNSTGIGAFDSSISVGDGGHGGGIYNSGSDSSLTNCTVSGNLTADYSTNDLQYDASISDLIPTGTGSGGGIFNRGKNLLISCCTICNNKTGTSSWNSGHIFGGGIYCDPAGTIMLENTLVANNEVDKWSSGPDCYGKIESHGYNLVEEISGCSLSGVLTGNITGVDPLLGPLAGNGGFTRTHALLPGSPAIDAGNSFGITEDQRGRQRPVDFLGITNAGDAADIGAYELESSNSVTISGSITYSGNVLAGVTLIFSNQGGTAVTNENGYYSHAVPYNWSGTVTPIFPNYFFTPSKRDYSHVIQTQSNQDYAAGTMIPPQIFLNRTSLNFGFSTPGGIPGSQTVLIGNKGGGILNWNASTNVPWLLFTPSSGIGDSILSVSIDATGLAAGIYNGIITISDSNAGDSPQTIAVSLHVYGQGQTALPFGEFATPQDGSAVSGSIAVTGWVLDDIGVANVKIYNGEAYIGDAVMVEGARPDIETAFPDYPNNYKAGWGYMLLTNCLPGGGNGSYNLIAKATDIEGNEVTLGSKSITIDNAHAVKPFGALDTPTQGGTASGNKFINNGWALTPQPNMIPIDGSTIDVVIDGVVKGHPIYNISRWDIAWFFPGLANSDGAAGYYYIDTTKLANGVHTIAWIVKDSAGNSDGIGSRYFTVQNLSGGINDRKVIKSFDQTFSKGGWQPQPNKSFDQTFSKVWPPAGSFIQIKELERVEINLSNEEISAGYLVVGDQLRELPIGSTLDTQNGIFYWQPGPGFLGTYRFMFIETDQEGNITRKVVQVDIMPKF